MATKSALIVGTPYFSPVGVNSGTDLGNSSKITVSHEVEKIAVANYQGGGGNDDAFERLTAVRIALTARRVSIPLLEIALGGSVATVATGAVNDEPHEVVALGTLIALDHMQDMSAALTVEAGATTFVEGVDYLRKRVGIVPVAGGGITVGADLLISYQKAKHLRVQDLLSTSAERGFLFDGLNERTNKPWAKRYYRVSWGVAKVLELIGSDFVSFEIEGEALAWDGITDPAKSKFGEMLIGDDL